MLVVPKKTDTRYDILDSLRDERTWTIDDLVVDTGRTKGSIRSVVNSLNFYKMVVHTPGTRALPGTVQITNAGLRWVWAVDNGLPGQAVDLVLLLLKAVEDGPMLTTQISPTGMTLKGRAREVLQHLYQGEYIEVTRRTQAGGGSAASRCTITDKGLNLLRETRLLPCFHADAW